MPSGLCLSAKSGLARSPAQALHLCGRQSPRLPEREPGVGEAVEAASVQRDHAMPDRFEHAADLTLAPLMDDHT